MLLQSISSTTLGKITAEASQAASAAATAAAAAEAEAEYQAKDWAIFAEAAKTASAGAAGSAHILMQSPARCTSNSYQL